jgi:Type I site-specific restriction-modification system, R (restriction) subunit and related helicases
MPRINEDQVEQFAINWFKELEYDYLNGYDIAPDGDNPKRDNYQEVILAERLHSALIKLNPNLPLSTIEEAIDRIRKHEHASLIQNNRAFHKLFLEGISVEIKTDDGTKGEKVKLVDFHNSDNNDFLIVNQFTVQGTKGHRRPDMVVFINESTYSQ